MDQPKSPHIPRWGMVVDVNCCVGCQTCTVACKHANDTLPGVQWRRVMDVELGEYPDVQRLFIVAGCQHCAKPPCVPVCPTGATWQRDDGLVIQDYDLCIGCGYCAVACPYQARTIVHEQAWYYDQPTAQESVSRHEDRLGVAQKCTFCKDRIDEGVRLGRKPGIDPAATPACSAACIAQAIHFGDFNDPGSNVARLVRENPSLQLNADLGTDPQIKYLFTTPAVPGRCIDDRDFSEERLQDRSNPLVGAPQTFWDWRAAMNWIFGGVGSGLAIAAWAAIAGGIAPLKTAAALQLLGAALIASGLLCVFFKIGRKLRFWRALARPQTSWMTREIYAVGLLFGAVLVATVQPSPAVAVAIAAFSAVFLICQAKILHMARGIPAWRGPFIPWMIVASALLEGWGLLTVMLELAGSGHSTSLLITVGLCMIAVNAGLWRAFCATARGQGIGPLARLVIRRTSLPLHVIGHALPALAFAMAPFELGYSDLLLLIAGTGAVSGGAIWKFSLVVHAGHQHGFVLQQVPQRGSGSRAAPARLAV